MKPKEVVERLVAAATPQEVVKVLSAHNATVIDVTIDELTKSGRLRDKPANPAVLKEVVRDEQGRITAVLEQAVEVNDPRSK